MRNRGRVPILFSTVLIALASVIPAAGAQTTHADGLTSDSEYLLEFDGPVPTTAVSRIQAAGGVVLGYLPDANALMVRFEGAGSAVLASVAGVVDVTAVPRPAVIERSMEAGVVPGLYTVVFDPDAGVDVLSGVSGVVVLEASDRAALVRAASAAQLASTIGVAAVEPFAVRALRNEYAGGVILGSAIAEFSGYDGSGQIVGVADSGLGTGVAATAHRDIAASRIVSINDWPATDYPGCWTATNDGAADPDNGHGTHVTGSVLSAGGLGGEGRGTAPGASLVFQSVEDFVDFSDFCTTNYGYVDGYYLLGIPSDVGLLFEDAYDDGARVHNDSWGFDDYGDYSTDSAAADLFVWEHQDMAIVVAAGNAGEDLNNDGVVDLGSVGSPATAKNVIAVGASENDRGGDLSCDATNPITGGSCSGSGGNNTAFAYGAFGFGAAPLAGDSSEGNEEQMAAFSSRGPTHDGRIKPDVVAPGTWILSTYSDLYQLGYDPSVNPLTGFEQTLGWGLPFDEYYKYNGGTSMASPLVAGSAAVVRQFVEDSTGDEASAALVKAILINSAVDLLDENNDGADDNDHPIPNMHEGWGRVDLAEAVDGDRVWFDSSSVITGATSSFELTAPGGQPLKLSLAWSDFPATPGGSSDLINDIDLVVTAPNGDTYRGNTFSAGWSTTGGSADRVNNVENVYVASATAGTWTVEVVGHNVPLGPQSFALVADGTSAVANTAPAITITSPTDGASVAGMVDIEAFASDDTGIASIAFLVDGVVVGTDTDGADGWSTTWDAAPEPNGAAVLAARATDLDGVKTTDSISVSIDNPDPTVAVSSPSGSGALQGTVALVATATNTSRVDFRIDGSLIGTDSNPAGGWTLAWDTAPYPDGNHTVRVTATSPNGRTASDTLVVELDNLAVGGTFTDDDGNVHEPLIEAIAADGITHGCSLAGSDESRYCPEDVVTRGQMAAFLVRAFDLPVSGADTFDDDDLSIFEGDIEALYAAGVTKGCNPPTNDQFCPDDPVTRGQMAAFLTRAAELAPGTGNSFSDDDGSVFEAEIEAIAAAGIAKGCNPPLNDRYCAEQPVQRDQMASFLARALNLTPLHP